MVEAYGVLSYKNYGSHQLLCYFQSNYWLQDVSNLHLKIHTQVQHDYLLYCMNS